MATIEDVRGWCDRAGMRPDSPLRAALLTATEAAETARVATTGARGLTPEGEQDLIRRVAEAAAIGAEREMARLARRLDLRTGLALAFAGLLLAGGGYALGRWDGAGSGAARAEGLQGAAFVAQVAELNDLVALRRHCERHAYREQGRLACNLPPVWIRSALP
jgi:hypothetical protein